MSQKRTRLFNLALVAFVALLGLFWGLTAFAQSAYDDAYITYRYAANLANGHGFVYNPGEWVLGVTTPLYALLLAPIGMLGLPAIVTAGHWIGIVCWIATALLAGALLHQLGSTIGAMVATLLIIVQPTLLSSLGMETTLVTALMLLSAWSWLGRHTWVAAISGAALLIARQDAALWLLFLGIGVWVNRTFEEGSSRNNSKLEQSRPIDSWIAPIPWREGIGSLLLTIPWFAFSLWRYGSLLPNSASAKIGQRSGMHVTGEKPFLLGFIGAIHGAYPSWVVVGLFALASLGIIAIALRARHFWWLPLWLVAYLTVYVALGVVNFPWYYAPPLVALCLLSGIGVAWLAGELAPNQPGRSESSRTEIKTPLYARRLIAITLGLAAILLLFPVTIEIVHSRNINSQAGKPAAYTATGHWLEEHSPPGSTIATIEIGIVGFWSQQQILDTMGLVSPLMSRHLTGWTDTLVYAITHFWPDYALTLPNTAWDPLIVQPWFQANYESTATLGSPPVTLYQRIRKPPAPISLSTPINFGGQLLLSAFAFECAADLVDSTSSDNTNATVVSGERCDSPAPLSGWLDLTVTRPLTANHQLTLALVDAATQERHSITQLWPYGHYNLYPTSHWPLQETMRVPFTLDHATNENLPIGTYRLGLALYDEAAEETLLLDTPTQGASGGDLAQMGWLRYGDPPTPVVSLEDAKHFTPVIEWTEGLVLDEVRLPISMTAESNLLTVQLTWQVVSTPDRDLTLFLHLLDANEQIVAQLDRKPFAGRFPTPVWRPGETLAEQVDIALPSPLQPGQYALRLGWYDEAGRVPLVDGDDSFSIEDALTVR